MNDMEHPPMTVASRSAKSRSAKARPAGSQSAKAGTVVQARPNGKGGAWHTVTFGDVTVTAQRPSEAEIRRNAEASTAALKRALPAFLRPGVRIYPKKDVPLFWADEDNPENGFIRKLNGKVERGVLDEDGTFKAID
jgi:hypothetical protein